MAIFAKNGDSKRSDRLSTYFFPAGLWALCYLAQQCDNS